MNPFRRAGLAALSACSLVLSAAEPGSDPALAQYRQIAETGRYEHALRAVELRLTAFPDDPRLLAFREQMLESIAQAKDDRSRLPAPQEPPPPIGGRTPESGRNFTVAATEIPMIWIAPGTFLLSNPQGSDDDTLVTLSRGYWLGRTEVTQEQWQTIMEHLPSPSFFKGSDRPVERVSWSSAMEFCRKLTERELIAGRLPDGYEYTLPTEAQWEYACRAGTTGPHAGDLVAMAWYAANSGAQTHPVAQKKPNAWGLYDMHGNVAEWCRDGYGGYPGGAVTDLMNGYDGPSAAMARVLRGGAFVNTAGQCRSANRYSYLTNYSGFALGFRVALAPVMVPKAPAADHQPPERPGL